MERSFSGFQSDFTDINNEYSATEMKVQKRSQGEKWADLAGDAASYGAQGAAIGAMFGGVGAPIGATIGALVGATKGALEWRSEDKKEEDMTKQAEKYNAALQQMKDARIRARALSNDTKAMQIQSQIQSSNMSNYLSDIQNPY